MFAIELEYKHEIIGLFAYVGADGAKATDRDGVLLRFDDLFTSIPCNQVLIFRFFWWRYETMDGVDVLLVPQVNNMN